MNTHIFKSKNLISSLAILFLSSLLLIGCGTKTEPASEDSTESTEEAEVDFPTEPIKITVPWSPGGSSDAIARSLAETISSDIDESINIVNREGANGTIAAAEAVNYDPDGHEILFLASGVMTAQPYLRDVQYDLEDFEGIAALAQEPIVLAVNTDSNWENLDDLIEEKDSEKIIKYGHSGAGGFPDVAQSAFFEEAEIKSESVPFEGGNPAVAALLGGHIDTVAAHPSEVLPNVESGDLKILGVFTEERVEGLDDVPTFTENGFDLNLNVWYYFLVPKDTPENIVGKLRNIVTDALDDPEYKEFLDNNDIAPINIEPDEVISQLKKETEKTQEVLSSLGF